ncbi:hypothetical protein [Actinacidiphila soli]|uniref:hypothetical protein n=1 Tax=Actinacidiphila soli TaxID=2487275 RepID=UPI000FCADAF6|nr:hypothetical protein [Actinacidiphila soli]
MSAQTADAGYPTRPEPTIRTVRAALPAEHRQAFQDDIERAGLDQIRKVLADWDVRARALADPAIVTMATRIADEHAGRAQRPHMLADEEIRTIAPALRP